jgi:hypothetical protein
MTSQQGTTEDGTNLVIDDRLDSYESFFDHTWARSFFQLVDLTKLEPLAFDLCADWKGTANTGRLPWVVIDSLEGFHAGYSLSKEPFWQKLTKALREHFLDRTNHTFSLTKRKELVGIIDKVSADVQEDIRKAPPAFDRQEIWAGFLGIGEFTLSLWSSQRLCYGAVYYAYENFLRQCVCIGNKKPVYRPHDARELQADLNTLFGSTIGDTCLDDDRVIRARRVRNALVHNGGRATSEMQTNAGTLRIVNGKIHIMPPDVRELYNLLKDHVTALAEDGRTLPQFRI